METHHRLIILFIIILFIFILLSMECVSYRHPIIKTIPPTKSETLVCKKLKPEYNSTLVTEPTRIYWTMASGNIKVCVKNRDISKVNNTGMSDNKK